jgi:hypothetical protein
MCFALIYQQVKLIGKRGKMFFSKNNLKEDA